MHVEADRIGHAVLLPDGGAFEQVADRWPEVVSLGTIDRALLADIVFRDGDQLAYLESVTHPAIRAEIDVLVAKADAPVVVELPIPQMLTDWKRVIVDAPETLRIERLLARGMSREDAANRMANQPTRSEWLAEADFVFDNGGDVEFSTEFERLWRWLQY